MSISDNVQEQINALIRTGQKEDDSGSPVVKAYCVFNGEIHINVYITDEKKITSKTDK